ncbi:MAG: LamG domain-containing protein [Patescibacteria group bacterium]|nr:LamG domain-containing protein [Patescibacteria group bacterium]
MCFSVSTATTGRTIISSGVNTLNGSWQHIAVTRNGSTEALAIFINGVSRASSSSGPTGSIAYEDGWSTGGNTYDPFIVLGAEKHDPGVEYPSFNGLMDELRISYVVRYTAAFTVPTAEFDPDTSTVGLYHFTSNPRACTRNTVILDSSGAPGGPSNGICRFGGTTNQRPVFVADSPFSTQATPVATGIPPSATPVPTLTSAIVSLTSVPSLPVSPQVTPGNGEWTRHAHDAQRARYTIPFTRPAGGFTADADAVALYKMNEASGTTLLDSSGNSRSMTLGSGTAQPARVTSTAASN